MGALSTHAFGHRGSACGVHAGDYEDATEAELWRGIGLSALSENSSDDGDPDGGGIYYKVIKYSGGLGGHMAHSGLMPPDEGDHGRRMATEMAVEPGGPGSADRGGMASRGGGGQGRGIQRGEWRREFGRVDV